MIASDGKELTLRGLALGVALTLLFTAANIYLGLKVGLTFATSIPAAVISMALLGLFSGSNIRENNIVQTVCSAAGAMASIIFVLPGLVIVGWWKDFPFWMSFLLCASGGMLGVLFTIPLRRALVTNSDLPYPEGVAGAEVLRVGSDSRAHNPHAREGLMAVILGSAGWGRNFRSCSRRSRPPLWPGLLTGPRSRPQVSRGWRRDLRLAPWLIYRFALASAKR